MKRRTLTRLAAAVSLATGIAGAASLPAQADGGGGHDSNEGNCSMSSTWELKGSADHGKVRVEVRVDTGQRGQIWDWQILDNGMLAAEGQSKTHQSSDGRFEVHRRIDNLVGPDTIDLMATNAASGETCMGEIVVHGRS